MKVVRTPGTLLSWALALNTWLLPLTPLGTGSYCNPGRPPIFSPSASAPECWIMDICHNTWLTLPYFLTCFDAHVAYWPAVVALIHQIAILKCCTTFYFVFSSWGLGFWWIWSKHKKATLYSPQLGRILPNRYDLEGKLQSSFLCSLEDCQSEFLLKMIASFQSLCAHFGNIVTDQKPGSSEPVLSVKFSLLIVENRRSVSRVRKVRSGLKHFCF